jgi:transketolase
MPTADFENLKCDVRIEIAKGLFAAGGGHYGGAMSVVDILIALYGSVPGRELFAYQDSGRDRLILSKGHAAIALYAVLKQFGIIDSSTSLGGYGHLNRRLEGHPDMTQTPGVDFSSGSLGQGLAAGLGMAFALRQAGGHVWVVVGDGECQEGQIWESAMLASRYQISNLHVIVDVNEAQEVGWTYQPHLNQTPSPNSLQKWTSFGWAAREVDGHCYESIVTEFSRMRGNKYLPTVVLASTMKGKGISMFEENPVEFHCTSLTVAQHEAVLNELYEKKTRGCLRSITD